MSQITDPLALRALDLIQAGIRAADPEHATSAALPDLLATPPAGGGVWHIVALGKAARAMAKAALDALPKARALVVTNAGNDAPLPAPKFWFPVTPFQMPQARPRPAASKTFLQAPIPATGCWR